MLPECRLNEYLYPVPPFTVEKDNVEDFADELRKFHKEFSDCFARSETREHFFDYMVGQLSHIEKKSVEPIAVSVSGVKSVRSMQKASPFFSMRAAPVTHRSREVRESR